jgi:MinD superfamily P-loop ATPase
MQRIIPTAARFGVKIAVCINKYDNNLENTAKIERYCQENDLAMVGKIPYDPNAIRAINNGQSIVDIDCPSGSAVKKVYEQTIKLL